MDDPAPLETIMDVREELMVSPVGDSKPTLRTSHFLNPISNSIDYSLSEALSSSASSVPTKFEPKEWPLKINFHGWRWLGPPKKWVSWLNTLYPKYQSQWKKVGIFDAIMTTKCIIVKAEELVIGVAEKWCSKTNTFVFPWGEATITLEDVMVLGGYPLLGEPVFTKIEEHKEEMKKIEEKLILARREAGKSKYNKASISPWMDLFITSECEIEHEAFLATWLSLFVFNHGGLVMSSVFPMAIHLARGNTVALAPAVLASIYKDLGLLKRAIVGLVKDTEVAEEVRFEVTLRSPFYLVQIWVWERFKKLQPLPNKLIKNEDPVLAKWDKVKALKIDNVRVALNSGNDDFLWRPYARYASKWKLFYPENEMWVPFDNGLDKELMTYVTCLRVSELVGFGSNSLVKQYFPNRVAMQFGMDQDVPAFVPRFNETQSIAWENYCRAVSDKVLYFPSRLFEADVTPLYVEWWKQSMSAHMYSPLKNIVQTKRIEKSSNRSGNDADVPIGFASKGENGKKSRHGGDNDADVPPGFLAKSVQTCADLVQNGSKGNEIHDADDCSPKHENLNTVDSFENWMPRVFERNSGCVTRSPRKVTSDEPFYLSASSSASTTEHGAQRKALLQTKLIVVEDDTDNETCSMEALGEDFEDANGNKEQRVSCDNVRLPNAGSEGEGYYGCSAEMDTVDLEERICRLEKLFTKEKIARFGHP